MEKEKKILTYFFSWLLMGILVCFIGITEVFAETYTPDGARSQLRTLLTNGTEYWNDSENGAYGTPLYFGTGPTYSTYGIPCNMRLIVITDVSTDYSYKFGYNMTIYTPYSVSNTWDSSKLDTNYDLKVADDNGVVKDSKCTVINTDIINGNTGVYTTKYISCVVTVKKDYTDAWLSTGYYCRGDCSLTNMEPLGYIPQDSYMTITSPTYERFEDNSNVIIDQNQTIIDQNNKTNEELGNIKDNINESTEDLKESIEESNKETQEVIKDQFNSCRDSYNLFNKNNLSNYGFIGTVESDGAIIFNSGNNINNTITITGFEENTQYTIRYEAKKYKTDANIAWVRFYYTDGTNSGTNARIDNLNYSYQIKEFTSESGKTIERIYFYNGGNGNNYSWKLNVDTLMLVKGKTIGDYEPYGEKICSNKIDETNDKLDNLTGAITDSSSPNTGALENSAGWLPPGPLDSVLNLPLSLFNALTTNLNKSCNPINIPLPYVNKNITLPCINTLYNQIGITSFLSWIGVIVSGLMLYTYLLKLYKWIEDRISLNETHNVDSWGGL